MPTLLSQIMEQFTRPQMLDAFAAAGDPYLAEATRLFKPRDLDVAGVGAMGDWLEERGAISSQGLRGIVGEPEFDPTAYGGFGHGAVNPRDGFRYVVKQVPIESNMRDLGNDLYVNDELFGDSMYPTFGGEYGPATVSRAESIRLNDGLMRHMHQHNSRVRYGDQPVTFVPRAAGQWLPDTRPYRERFQ